MMPSDVKRKLKEAIRRYKTDWRSDVKEVAKYQIDTITKQYPEEAATVKRFEGYRDSKMTKNSLMKFIDSCVGNIARKIEDEFRESDHPRDKGGKFTSKGNEERGGGAGKEEKSSSSKPAKKVDAKASRHIHQVLEDEIRQIAENSADKDEFKYNLEAFLEDDVQDDRADTDERATDNFGYDKETVHAVAEEMKGEIDSIADDFFEEEDDDSVTGPEDRDYMLEEDDDADVVPSLEQYKKNVSENFDGDEEYEVEARYDRAKYHSDKFKKLKNGEYRGTPEEKYLKNYYRRLGMKKPEDAFKVWWDI